MKTLIDKNHIQNRISEMALEIDKYYKKQEWYQKSQEPVIVIGVLTGAVFFMADLVRELSIRMKLDFIRVSTYPGKATIAQKPEIITEPTVSLHNARILIIDDILDTGKTLGIVKPYLAWPSSNIENIKTTVLLRKPGKAPDDIKADFVGFDIPDEFVVGMGLDYDGKYREMPYVAIWRKEDEHERSKSEVGRG